MVVGKVQGWGQARILHAGIKSQRRVKKAQPFATSVGVPDPCFSCSPLSTKVRGCFSINFNWNGIIQALDHYSASRRTLPSDSNSNSKRSVSRVLARKKCRRAGITQHSWECRKCIRILRIPGMPSHFCPDFRS